MIAMGENKRCRLVEDLLPGILDCIVLDKIVPKMEWKDFYTLSSVSYAWYNAIRSRRVFNSRVLSNSLETLVACYTRETIALYSMRENSWHELPRIVDICGGHDKFPALAECVSMDGKVYVLGGMIDSEISNKVFVFDLAGQGRWEQCASMKQPRRDFGSAVIDGKIYVFGGKARCKLRNSEVYEPKEDTWSPFRPMATTQVGEELLNHPRFPDGRFPYGEIGRIRRRLGAIQFKDEWRLAHSWNLPKCGLLFTVHGNAFSIEPNDIGGLESLVIRTYDHQGNSWNSWIHVCSFSFAALIPVEYDSIWPCARPDAVLAVDDELIALVCFQRKHCGTYVLCLLQSTGFGDENQKISWKLRATYEQVPDAVNNSFAIKL